MPTGAGFVEPEVEVVRRDVRFPPRERFLDRFVAGRTAAVQQLGEVERTHLIAAERADIAGASRILWKATTPYPRSMHTSPSHVWGGRYVYVEVKGRFLGLLATHLSGASALPPTAPEMGTALGRSVRPALKVGICGEHGG